MPMKDKKILVVDDEKDLLDILCFNLTTAGFEAQAASSGADALLLHPETFDLLLLDVMMPGMSGFELAQQLRHAPQTARLPIIFLTAKDTEEDLLRGFRLGADDYVTKPFSVREVLARVKAVLSRATAAEGSSDDTLSYEGLSMNTSHKTVVADGHEVMLTKTEFELLRLLLTRQGQVLSRQQLLEGAWPQNVVVTDRTVDVNIARLRKKIGAYASCIVSRQGFGYCFGSVSNDN